MYFHENLCGRETFGLPKTQEFSIAHQCGIPHKLKEQAVYFLIRILIINVTV